MLCRENVELAEPVTVAVCDEVRVRVNDDVDVCVDDAVGDLVKRLDGVPEIVADDVTHVEIVPVGDVVVVEVREAVGQVDDDEEDVTVDEVVADVVEQDVGVDDIDTFVVTEDVLLIVGVRDVTDVEDCVFEAVNVTEPVIDTVWVAETVDERDGTRDNEALTDTEGE